MKRHQQTWTGIVAAFGLLLLILDTKSAIAGVNEGLKLSFYTVIPSLFPFLILSFLVNRAFCGIPIPILTPLGKLCNMPIGSESVLLLGFLGGYPVGAECIKNAYISGNITEFDAKRMLGFCSNAGPAFIFGMCSCLFSSAKIPWVIWAVHIISALLVGCILPRSKQSTCRLPTNKPASISDAVQQSLKTIGNVCAWVIVFRVIIQFVLRWFLWILPPIGQITIAGILELANGCNSLYSIPFEPKRFILSTVFLGLGGLCVAMQTVSVTKELGIGMYFPGKVLQSIISFLIAIILQKPLFPADESISIPLYIPAILLFFIALIIISLYKSKKQ